MAICLYFGFEEQRSKDRKKLSVLFIAQRLSGRESRVFVGLWDWALYCLDQDLTVNISKQFDNPLLKLT